MTSVSIDVSKVVSSTTYHKFQVYESLLTDWNSRMSLVQRDTLNEFFTRHILDSLQIIPLISQKTLHSTDGTNAIQMSTIAPLSLQNGQLLDDIDDYQKNVSIIDVGSGAGFPGMVLAICGFQNVTLCDSNYKKCLFLEEVARQTGTKVHIINDRVENLIQKYDVIVSRATMDLTELMAASHLLSSNSFSYGIFHKGKTWEKEVFDAATHWHYIIHINQSVTSNDGVVVRISNLKHK